MRVDSLSFSKQMMEYLWTGGVVPSSNKNNVDIAGKLQDIIRYGIGYSDIIGTICFPLIIALFAFSCPFIFQAINHINDKYASKEISLLFSKSWRYKTYWITTYLSIVLLLVVGILTLILSAEDYDRYIPSINWVTLAITTIYVLAIILFITRCIRFNKPDMLLVIIMEEDRYDVYRAKLHRCKIFLKQLRRIIFHRKDMIGNGVLRKAIKITENIEKDMPDENLIVRLSELSRYAVQKRDSNLMSSIFNSLSGIIYKEKNAFNKDTWNLVPNTLIKEGAPHNNTLGYFDNLTQFYSSFDSANYMDSSIIFSMFSSFNRTRYVGFRDSYLLFIFMRNLIENNNRVLLEKYIEYSRYFFIYIRTLPQVLYILGGSLSDRTKVEKAAIKSWNDLCDFHYLAMAYAFSKGEYYILRTVIEKEAPRKYNVYPTLSTDILLRYASVLQNGTFRSNDHIFKENVDVIAITTIYTCALLRILGKETVEWPFLSEIITVEALKKLNMSKTLIVKWDSQLEKNAKLSNMFPKLLNNKAIDIYDKALEFLKRSNGPFCPKVSNELKRKEFKQKSEPTVKSFVYRVKNVFSGRRTQPPVSIDCYKAELNATLKNEFAYRVDHLFENTNYFRYRHNELKTNSNGKDEGIPLNECQMVCNKASFVIEDFRYYREDLYNSLLENINNRIIYCYLQAFSKMKVEEHKAYSSDFDALLKKITNNNPKAFVMISVDSPLGSILIKDFKFEGLTRYYQGGTPLIEIESVVRGRLLTDTPAYDYFKESMLVIAKDDLPTLVDIKHDKGASTTYVEETDETKMIMNVRINIDINKKLVYNPNAKVYAIRVNRMAL